MSHKQDGSSDFVPRGGFSLEASYSRDSVTESDSGAHLTFLPSQTDSSTTITPELRDAKELRNGSCESLEADISNRIATVYKGIQKLEKKKAHFDKSIRSATRTSVNTTSANLKPLSSAIAVSKQVGEGDRDEASPPLDTTQASNESDSQASGGKMTGKGIDVTRQYPKMFGLDPMKVLQSSDSESSGSGEDQLSPRTMPQQQAHAAVGKTSRSRKKSWRRELEKYVQQEPPRDMSAIMPTLSEKNFLSKLYRREKQLNKEINDMRNNLDVINLKAEHQARKAKGTVRIQEPKDCSTKLSLSRILTGTGDGAGDKEPSRELMDFLQATGGATGGWKVEEHQAFMRLFKKNCDRPVSAQLKVLSTALPDKSAGEIAHHLKWFERYNALNDANKNSIRVWQERRRAEREAAFQRISQVGKQKAETERKNQELIQMKREEERQKNMEKLALWKLAKSKNRRLSVLEQDKDSLKTSDRINKMDMDLMSVKRDIREITTLTRDMGKSFQSLTRLDTSLGKLPQSKSMSKLNTVGKPRKERAATGSSEASSGFCDMSPEEIDKLGKEILNDSSRLLGSSSTDSRKKTRGKSTHDLSQLKDGGRDMHDFQVSRKLLQDFRLRDLELVEARRKSILERKEKLRNPAFLNQEQLRDRMRRNSALSKVLDPTKGWMIRKDLMDLEKTESAA